VSSAPLGIEKASPRSLPQPLTSICAGATAVGAAAFAFGLSTEPQTAWLAYHSNFMFFATLSQAGLVLASIFVIVGAKWPGPLRRMAEGLAAWVPISLILCCFGYFGGDYIFEWMREGAVHGKEPWLNPARVYITDIAILAVLTGLTFYFLKTSTRPLLGGGAMDGASGFAKNMADRWTAGWRGDEVEQADSKKKLETIAPLICLLYGLGYSLIAFDQVMSMEQTWFSNLFGAYVAWGGMLSAVAATAVLAVLYRKQPGFTSHITEARLHDIGKLIFGFSIFWFYLYWAQYLVIYYGNLPEETAFFRDRLGDQFVIDKGFTAAAMAKSWTSWDFQWARFSQAYGWHSMVVWLCLWIIPFWVLLGQKPKKTPWILGPVSGAVLLGVWLERNLLIWPSVVKDDATRWMGVMPLLIGVGFVGAYVLVYLVYARVFPSIAVEPES
jgi:hypothetical protein